MQFSQTLPRIMTKINLETTILIFLMVGLNSCSDKENDRIFINGKIEGKKAEKVEFTTPINGKWFYGNKTTIATDSIGTFKIEMDIEEPSFITIYSSGKAGILLVEPSMTYDVNYDFKTKQKRFSSLSADSIGQNLYNTLPPPDFNLFDIGAFLQDSIPAKISSKINEFKEKEISKFDKLLEKGKISNGFHKLSVLDRECYYQAVETRVANLLLGKFFLEKNTDGINDVREFWKKKLDITKLTESDYTRSPWYYTLVDNLIRFEQLSAEKFNFENLNQSFQTIDNYENNIKQAKTYLSGEKLEYYLASYIFFQSWASKDNSKDIIKIYDQFKREYPDSRYHEYLITSVRPIIDFHEKLENAPTNEKIQLVKNQENIDTFDELIKELRGKKIFVDIWGTWCGPCKKEFQLKDKYAEILKSKEIIVLYICEGKNSKKKNWSEMIEFYELEGQHIFTNEKLLADIHDRFGKNGFAYPRYLLVDENGKVVKEEASYPSKTEQLEKEINENYVW